MSEIVRHASTSPSLLSPISNFLIALLLGVALSFAAVAQASANPRYAAFVIDAKTGQVLFERYANEHRYPASLTKMMTLYLVFEAMADGRISKSTRIPISANAAAEPPTKIGLPVGATISVDKAILALVTKSANDISTAVGEFLGGSEGDFARIMTNKAHRLGMKSTTFRNAHGLPNSAQKTTARDMAILGIALREHFPQYYDYFSAKSAVIDGKRYGNHNNLLGRVKGVDGIKTGYIRASGFNLVSSVETGGRSIVAVVMGGRTSRTRDAHMIELINKYLPRASKGASSPLLAARTGSSAFAIAGIQTLPTKNIPTPIFRPVIAAVQENAYAATTSSETMSKLAAVASARVAAAWGTPTPTPPRAVPEPAPAVDTVKTASTRPDGWAVQVAAAHSKSEALALLASTSEAAGGILASAKPFTETYDDGGTLYYRARFGGFASKSAAWDACNALKRKKIDCYAMQL